MNIYPHDGVFLTDEVFGVIIYPPAVPTLLSGAPTMRCPSHCSPTWATTPQSVGGALVSSWDSPHITACSIPGVFLGVISRRDHSCHPHVLIRAGERWIRSTLYAITFHRVLGHRNAGTGGTGLYWRRLRPCRDGRRPASVTVWFSTCLSPSIRFSTSEGGNRPHRCALIGEASPGQPSSGNPSGRFQRYP